MNKKLHGVVLSFVILSNCTIYSQTPGVKIIKAASAVGAVNFVGGVLKQTF